MKRCGKRCTLAALGLLLTALGTSVSAQDARIVEWVESAPASDDSRIALGYPVPTTVDTPLPFDGFRSYSGLHARHQDLAISTPWVHAWELGQTRNGRVIWIYQLGDADFATPGGKREQAMLTNGGIHAREWQSPEVATGIIELMALAADDDPLIAYLRENANILVIPVLNVDGFLQTQRYPSLNWLGTDPNDPDSSPRDGRMRRKNMLGADEDLFTFGDHLLGVDLNRNNPPFWAATPDRSSDDPESLVHHGAFAHSEPEALALAAAAELAPAAKLSMYTDVHSYSQVHLWGRTNSDRLANLTERLLRTFSNHHQGFPAGKYYYFDNAEQVRLFGIGATDEYFLSTFRVPSWTLEVEPSYGFHPGLPGHGADYGGLGRNGHDGFILPESEVERVRTELAQSFAIAYYVQSGPPAVAELRFVDKATGAVVFEAEWDRVDDRNRQLHRWQPRPLQTGREYAAWVAWDKPMRWREDGEVAPLQGHSDFTLNFNRSVSVEGGEITTTFGTPGWLDQPGGTPGGYLRYRDDAMEFDIRFPNDENNTILLQNTASATIALDIYDMTGARGDADPATTALWQNGGWWGYENSDGEDLTDRGGVDSTVRFDLTTEALDDPFVIEPGTTSAWFDPERDGEGFMLEILRGNTATMYWFTYDSEGKQDWYTAVGEIRGNRIVFPELIRTSGGVFGPGFDPEKVTRTVVGSASFIWSSCDSGQMEWVVDPDGSGPQQGRMSLRRITNLMGASCGLPAPLPPEIPEGRLSGSWYDPSHSGEGFVLQVLTDQTAVVYWFSYDAAGERRWFFGTGNAVGGKLVFDALQSTSGGVFGPGFDPEAVVRSDWGSLELDLACTAGIARFEPVEAGFPAGELALQRLTTIDGLSCED
jgi:murein tripeptide amidase MpaA